MKARKVRGLDPAKPLRRNAERIVSVRLDELQELSGPALEPGAAEAQHDLRIAAKRVRYVLEIFAACFGPEGARARRAAKELQSVLGELRDCDAMLAHVAGIESVEQLLRTRRELHHSRFLALWRDLDTQAALEGLSLGQGA